MPKVSKIRLKYDRYYGRDHDIYYSSKDGFSVKGLPEDFQTLTSCRLLGYNTEGELSNALHAACHKYREAKTQSRKIIAYKCIASCELRMIKTGYGSYSGLLPNVSPKIADTGYDSCLAQFGIDFLVLKVVDDGVRKSYYRIDSSTGEVINELRESLNDYQEMEYTEEREQFFLNLVESMKKMVVAASTFFGADSEQAVLFIEQNQKLLN